MTDELDFEIKGFRVAYRPDDYAAKEFGPIFVALPGSNCHMKPGEAYKAAFNLKYVADHALKSGWWEEEEKADGTEVKTVQNPTEKTIRLEAYQIGYILGMISAIKTSMDNGNIFSAGFKLGELREALVNAIKDEPREAER